MKDFALVLASVVLTAICWGIYGPVITEGQRAMDSSHLRPFICVGIAYFLIAVVAPALILRLKGETGRWTVTGTVWSLAAGAAGALGALGIILAMASKGQPIYVMPLVFGGAPVVSTFLTMTLARSYRQAGPFFFAGLILVAAGAAVVLVAKPRPVAATAHTTEADAPATPSATAPSSAGLTVADQLKIGLFIALTVVCWGVYGPILHIGQAAMVGSRLRPFMCVGLAYFLIAVLVPLALLVSTEEKGDFTFSGTVWSLSGGAAGALGALGIILAFTFGGKPIYVMPLVFGGAPVVNTLTTMLTAKNLGEVGPLFYAGLIIVALGATTVLIFAPKTARPGHAAAPAAT